MVIDKEILRIAQKENLLLPQNRLKSDPELNQHVEEAVSALEEGNADFSSFERMTLTQDGKSRVIRTYTPFSPPELLSGYIKTMLDRRFRISYPNRNKYIRSLFNTVYALKNMSDYTIFKFDFSDFFNSVSSVYVYEKYIHGKGLERFQEDLLEQYVNQTQYAYAGLRPSNIICEIAAKRLDELIMQNTFEKGLILYKRYVDDGILIFNRYMSKDDCLTLIQSAINTVFYDPSFNAVPPCRTKLNPDKTNHIARRDLVPKARTPTAFDFLGYYFEISINIKDDKEEQEIKYGISPAKIEKYTKRVQKIIKDYADSPRKNIEYLRHRIKTFTHRTVYCHKSGNGHSVWINKGFVANYCELQHHMDQLTKDTEIFLKYVFVRTFKKYAVECPYFMQIEKKGTKRGKKEAGTEAEPNSTKGTAAGSRSAYSLYYNLESCRTLLFVPSIGIDRKTLRKMCSQIGIVTGNKSYDELLREYLHKVGVGY